MKINKLILRNFSAVKNAMNANEVEIDFRSAKNKICLLVGPNGSGKTTLLGMLQPFADVGNLDVRNGNKLILEGKEGYKEIEIQKGKDTYVIKHFYSPQKDKNHSVKSYITKNGNDMNPNGNVTSFKEIVKEELQIEPEYLKLIRLGSNVVSMIELTTTERKNFMSKLMDEVGVYLEYYKSVNQKLRQVDELISHTVDKIKRLEITDEKEEKDKISSNQYQLKLIEKEYVEVSAEISKLDDIISGFGDKNEFYQNGKDLQKKYAKMLKILEKKDTIESFEVSFYDEKIKEVELLISKLENEELSNNLLIQNSMNHLNTLNEQMRNYMIQMDKEENTDKELEKMKTNHRITTNKLSELETNNEGFESSITKKDFDEFYTFVKNIQKMLSTMYEFGAGPVGKVIHLMRKKKNVMNYINSHLIELDEKKDEKDSIFLSMLATRFMTGKDIVINCKEECQAKYLFYQIQNLLKDHEVEDKTESIEFYRNMEFVYNNISMILPQFSDKKEVIDSLPSDIRDQFLVDNMYSKIEKLEYIYDDKLMNDYSSLLSEYDSYITLKQVWMDEEEAINKFTSISNLKYIKEQVESTQEHIDEEKDVIISLRNRNGEIQGELNEAKNNLELFNDIKETIEKFDEVKTDYLKYEDDKVVLEESNTKLSDLTTKQMDLNYERNQMTETIQKMISNLDQFKELKKDNKKLEKIYEDLSLIKDSLSSKTGIPLRIISSYLNNTNDITNKFLDIVYDGKIYIDEFNITSTEFAIPFFNNGVRIDDVKYASQGELSFLSIALSFALSSQVLSKYNIMLLDEIDGPLDPTNREKFIKILETQIDSIDSEQNFLITHNSMFTSYPVDILDLSFKNDLSDYDLVNYIEIKRF